MEYAAAALNQKNLSGLDGIELLFNKKKSIASMSEKGSFKNFNSDNIFIIIIGFIRIINFIIIIISSLFLHSSFQ